MQSGRPLHDDALELLTTLGHAASTAANRFRFEYQPLEGYPLGWLIHPGLRDGLSVIVGADLSALEQAGLVILEPQRHDSSTSHFVLTADGWQCYARATGGSISSSPPDDPPLRD